MKLTKNQKIGFGVLFGAVAVFIGIPMLATQNNTTTTDTPSGGGTTPSGSGTTQKTLAQKLADAEEVEYKINVALKGEDYATMQRILSRGVKEGAEYWFNNYAGLMMLSSHNGVNLRLSPGTSGTSVAMRNKDEGIGKTTGRFYKRNGLLWAELIPNPTITRPIPLAPVTKIYVALKYMKTVSPINNLNGLSNVAVSQKGELVLLN